MNYGTENGSRRGGIRPDAPGAYAYTGTTTHGTVDGRPAIISTVTRTQERLVVMPIETLLVELADRTVELEKLETQRRTLDEKIANARASVRLTVREITDRGRNMRDGKLRLPL